MTDKQALVLLARVVMGIARFVYRSPQLPDPKVQGAHLDDLETWLEMTDAERTER